MIVLRAYKTELDPNNAQARTFGRCCGVARFCYNWGLAAMRDAYAEDRKTSVLAERKRLNAIKGEEYPWLYEVPFEVLNNAFRNLQRAYENFFRRVRKGDKEKGFPKFKSRKRGIGGFTVRGSLRIEADRIRLPNIGWVRLKERGYLPTDPAKLMSFTITERAGRWFVSAQVEMEVPDVEPATGPALGIDLGIKALAVCSDGTVFENARVLNAAERRIKRLSRELARRKKGGANRTKTQRKLAQAHYKAACIRRHVIHQVSHHVTAKTKPSVVVLEDLHVQGMLKNHKLARAISDVAWGELRRQIEYKAAWHGVQFQLANSWYASSKTCSGCGAVRAELKLREREYVCPACGLILDRDLNAALNLVKLAA